MNLRQLYQWVKRESKTWAGSVGIFERMWWSSVAGWHGRRAATSAKSPGVSRDKQSPTTTLATVSASPNAAENILSGMDRECGAGTERRQVVLVVDETKLRNQFGVMVVGVG